MGPGRSMGGRRDLGAGYLHRAGAIADPGDLAPFLERALERNAAWFATTPYANHASLLMGDLGIRLVRI